jgi:hypothetical protein
VNRRRQRVEPPACGRAAREERAGVLGRARPGPAARRRLRGPLGGEPRRERAEDEDGLLLGLERIGGGGDERAPEQMEGELDARLQGPAPSRAGAQRFLEKLGGEHEHGALVAAARRVADAVRLVPSEDESRVRVDDGRLAPAPKLEDAAPRYHHLRFAAPLLVAVGRSRRSARHVEDADERPFEKNGRAAVGHARHSTARRRARVRMEPTGLEPVTFWLPARRSPS